MKIGEHENRSMSSSSLLMSLSSPTISLVYLISMIGSTIVSLGSNATAEKRLNSAYRKIASVQSLIEVKCYQLQRNLRKTMKVLLTDGRVIVGKLQVRCSLYVLHLVFRLCI